MFIKIDDHCQSVFKIEILSKLCCILYVRATLESIKNMQEYGKINMENIVK